MKKTLITLALLSLTACGGGDAGQDIVFETVVGPNTQSQIKALPNDMRGVQGDQRYLSTPPPEDMDPAPNTEDDGGS